MGFCQSSEQPNGHVYRSEVLPSEIRVTFSDATLTLIVQRRTIAIPDATAAKWSLAGSGPFVAPDKQTGIVCCRTFAATVAMTPGSRSRDPCGETKRAC